MEYKYLLSKYYFRSFALGLLVTILNMNVVCSLKLFQVTGVFGSVSSRNIMQALIKGK